MVNKSTVTYMCVFTPCAPKALTAALCIDCLSSSSITSQAIFKRITSLLDIDLLGHVAVEHKKTLQERKPAKMTALTFSYKCVDDVVHIYIVAAYSEFSPRLSYGGCIKKNRQTNAQCRAWHQNTYNKIAFNTQNKAKKVSKQANEPFILNCMYFAYHTSRSE